MKFFYLLLSTAAIAICTGSAYAQKTTALIFKERVYDFGNILEKKGKVVHAFVFENTSKAPVIISAVSSGCGCVVSDYPKLPVKPGEQAKITVSYNPNYRSGFFSKEVTVISNGNKDINRIWVKGTVIPYEHPVEEEYPYSFGSSLYLNLKVLVLGEIGKGQHKDIELQYANDSDKPITLTFSVMGDGKNIGFKNPGTIAPKQRGKMTITYTMVNEVKGDKVMTIYALINGKKLAQPLQVKVTGI